MADRPTVSTNVNPIVIIPARLRATRLPDKPLAEIGGEPMIVHVWRRACEAAVGEVVVACDDERIAAPIVAAGGRAVLTSPDHASGSDRIYEALTLVDSAGVHDVVVNVQGDLPTISGAAIRASLAPLAEPAVDIATLVAIITEPGERSNPNVVKCVASRHGDGLLRALYFSRATVPFGDGPLYHHIGLYSYRRQALARFVGLPASELERRERLEQLRALEAGMRIDAAIVDEVPLGVDTPADLDRARGILGRAPVQPADSLR